MEGPNQVYRVSERTLAGIEESIRDADRATDQSFARILRERSEYLAVLISGVRRVVTAGGQRAVSIAELLDHLDDERQWLDDVALQIAPPEGSS